LSLGEHDQPEVLSLGEHDQPEVLSLGEYDQPEVLSLGEHDQPEVLFLGEHMEQGGRYPSPLLDDGVHTDVVTTVQDKCGLSNACTRACDHACSCNM